MAQPAPSDDPRLNPFDWYRRMREHSPVSYEPQRGWGVFCYDDVQQLLTDHATFSSQFQGSAPQRTSQPLAASLISMDRCATASCARW